jgi:hypothetical protein
MARAQRRQGIRWEATQPPEVDPVVRGPNSTVNAAGKSRSGGGRTWAGKERRPIDTASMLHGIHRCGWIRQWLEAESADLAVRQPDPMIREEAGGTSDRGAAQGDHRGES